MGQERQDRLKRPRTSRGCEAETFEGVATLQRPLDETAHPLLHIVKTANVVPRHAPNLCANARRWGKRAAIAGTHDASTARYKHSAHRGKRRRASTTGSEPLPRYSGRKLWRRHQSPSSPDRHTTPPSRRPRIQRSARASNNQIKIERNAGNKNELKAIQSHRWSKPRGQCGQPGQLRRPFRR